jgi:hypothetical protein
MTIVTRGRILPKELRDTQKIKNCSNILYIQQDATLHSLLYLETAVHISGGTITHYQERIQLYLHHLVFVTPLLLSAAIVEKLELVCVRCGWRIVEELELVCVCCGWRIVEELELVCVLRVATR